MYYDYGLVLRVHLPFHRAANPTTAHPLQVYYVYGFMLLVFSIMMIVTACVTVVGTYFLLNAENYHWQVRPRVGSAASCSVPLAAPRLAVI